MPKARIKLPPELAGLLRSDLERVITEANLGKEDTGRGQIFTKDLIGGLEKQLSDCCCSFNRRLDAIECDMLKRPQLSGVASTCNGQLVPSIWGNGCNNGNNRNF